MSETQLRANLEQVPSDKNQFGRVGLPAALRPKETPCGQWEHARCLCVAQAITEAAADAGGRLGAIVSDADAVAMQAVIEASELLSNENHRSRTLMSIPHKWRQVNGLDIPEDSHKMASGLHPLPGLFEIWLRRKGAALMGPDSIQSWLKHATDRALEGLSRRQAMDRKNRQEDHLPSHFTLDGAVYDASQVERDQCTRKKKNPSAFPVANAWHELAWAAACGEVRVRFGEESRLHCVLRQQQTQPISFSMMSLYARLFNVPEPDAQLEQWRQELDAVHDAVHQKPAQNQQCTVCDRARLSQNSRRQKQEHDRKIRDWDFDAVQLLWEAVVDAVDQYGTGWCAWKHAEKPVEQPELPPVLQIENIPLEGNMDPAVRKRCDEILSWRRAHGGRAPKITRDRLKILSWRRAHGGRAHGGRAPSDRTSLGEESRLANCKNRCIIWRPSGRRLNKDEVRYSFEILWGHF